ncbi:hypothetical protein [Methylotuvimicrobium sp. KM2]|uniref:hypothetical protein n=1 Tax=Methylotuvimicrobium sp. KM2 TaxID=3133976 RepID=UPI0031012AA0
MDEFTQPLNSISHWPWLTILDNLGAGFINPCNSAIAEKQKSASAMDGVNADFAGAKICPAADICQSSNRALRSTIC